MGRKVKRRTSYTDDAIIMRRMSDAVEADHDSEQKWKDEVHEHLRELMSLFLRHETEGRKNVGSN